MNQESTDFDPRTKEAREVAGSVADQAGDMLALLAQYYRGEVGRTTTWRNRLDRTTNWAAILTASLRPSLFLCQNLRA